MNVRKERARALLVITPWSRRWELAPRGGIADDYYFIDAFTRAGYEVHYLGAREQAPPDVTIPGYVRHSFPNFFDRTARWPTPVRRLLWPVLFSVLALARGFSLAQRLRPVVIVGQTHVTSFAVWLLGLCLRRPTVVKLFGVEDLARTDLSRAAYLRRNAEQMVSLRFPHDAWIILDDGTGGREAALRSGVAPERVEYIPNGINVEWADGARDDEWLRETLDIPRDTAVALYLSRLVDWKQPDAVVRAAARVAERCSRSVVFVIAGDGPERGACEELARTLGVAAQVRFAGTIPHERVPDAMAAATVFVGTNARSNMSIPVCEAMVCGVPVVAFDTGETRRVVKDGVNGRTVAQGDTVALADAIVELVEKEDSRDKLARNARAFARESFVGWEERTGMELEIVAGIERAGRGGRRAGRGGRGS